MAVKFILLLVALVYLEEASGHGKLVEPPNRSTLWRFDAKQPKNYNDNELFCGGREVQYFQNDGRCGVCGDNYADPVPRSNENGGTFGNGVVTKTYTAGSVIDINVDLTANHLGTFTYSLCVLNDPSKPETEDCFIDLPLLDGSLAYNVRSTDTSVSNKIQLPAGLTCERCTLRWHYKSGNSWGVCSDGNQKMGCGPQETFRSCADVSIV